MGLIQVESAAGGYTNANERTCKGRRGSSACNGGCQQKMSAWEVRACELSSHRCFVFSRVTIV